VHKAAWAQKHSSLHDICSMHTKHTMHCTPYIAQNAQCLLKLHTHTSRQAQNTMCSRTSVRNHHSEHINLRTTYSVLLIRVCFLCNKGDLNLKKSSEIGQQLSSTYPRLCNGFLALPTAEPCVHYQQATALKRSRQVEFDLFEVAIYVLTLQAGTSIFELFREVKKSPRFILPAVAWRAVAWRGHVVQPWLFTTATPRHAMPRHGRS